MALSLFLVLLGALAFLAVLAALIVLAIVLVRRRQAP